MFHGENIGDAWDFVFQSWGRCIFIPEGVVSGFVTTQLCSWYSDKTPILSSYRHIERAG